MLSRRAFVLSAAAAGGALVVGLRIADRESVSSGSVGAGSEVVEIHNWITIKSDNTTTIRIARMEMGQGVMTSMAQLLAEELAVDWSKVTTEFISIRDQLSRGGIYGRTVTSSSDSVRESEALLRICGAQIRTMLVQAAAERLDVQASELTAENSVVTHRPTGRSLTFGELASAAAEIAVPEPHSVRLREPQEWTLIGKSVPRVDVPAKVDGTAVYGIDVVLPGMKHAAIAMNPCSAKGSSPTARKRCSLGKASSRWSPSRLAVTLVRSRSSRIIGGTPKLRSMPWLRTGMPGRGAPPTPTRS